MFSDPSVSEQRYGAKSNILLGDDVHKVGPQFGIAKLVNITPITMVYGIYIYI